MKAIIVIGAFLLGLGAALPDALIVQAQAPNPAGQPAIATGTVTIEVDGKAINTAGVINLQSGSGIVASAVPNAAQNRTDIVFSYNSALVPTHDQVHHNENFCRSSNGTVLYTCKLPNKALPSYQLGDVFELLADAPCTQNCQVNIDGVGALNIWSRDGSVAAAFPSGIPVWIWFDGKVMRLL